ncbi:hypothetical protein COL5a_000106 [Colletotrichum fioriniae]|uniref:SnoaL-like domain-containing protein n=1 Tax=Colletotrichum fioriniae PJ7 TaxID=1445577 RepID=A0A010RRE0_9PEZI|nr:uncharacterized protein COL516b_009088 [Colletotrichum fioriniae]EXF74828.1 hypothetical protein CFIO01_06505 [Colletotrichum fioriniae PJ7]KAJ0299584.1 hypothetical protein COL516b_009088 [Colletotrichum fioriniae]KAJ0334065.1 hypothetical protein COL5a_000106 [Colletotrichum fioriniae]KAJ3940320.1 hypothetical protein N0V96_009311 [Colletotrichum fioriniae]
MAFRQKVEATIKSFFEAYTDGEKQNDASIINREVTPDCTRQLLPRSMTKAFGIPGDFILDNAAYATQFAKDIAVFVVGATTVSNLVVDSEARKAALTSTSDIKFKDGSENLQLEFSWFFDFNEDGSKVTKVIEFCDKDSVMIMHSKVSANESHVLDAKA